jgi:hypothetical protein
MPTTIHFELQPKGLNCKEPTPPFPSLHHTPSPVAAAGAAAGAADGADSAIKAPLSLPAAAAGLSHVPETSQSFSSGDAPAQLSLMPTKPKYQREAEAKDADTFCQVMCRVLYDMILLLTSSHEAQQDTCLEPLMYTQNDYGIEVSQ